METIMLYEPREDSYLLEKQVSKCAFGNVLDIGTGTAIQALAAANSKHVRSVLAVDINPTAIEFCKKNIRNPKIAFKKSDLFDFVSGQFDTIILNPPYLPADPNEPAESAIATSGGKHGYEIMEKFFSQAKDYLENAGVIIFLISSLTNPLKVESIMIDHGFTFKRIARQKISFEELYVYTAEKSPIIKKLNGIRNITFLAKGHRGIVYSGLYKGKKIAIKIDLSPSHVSRVDMESRWLKILNKKNIGPKLLHSAKDFLIMEYIDGERLFDYVQRSNKNQIRHIIQDVFEQCYVMDMLQINKEEMHHPVKHIMITTEGARLIDFERCRKALEPKNVTQFCQFLTSGSFAYGLENKGLIINKRILKFAQKYKHDPSRKNFDSILEEI